MGDAHVLEHAHRDDSVVAAVDLPVVAEMEPGPLGKVRLGGAPARHVELLLRKGNAVDLDPASVRQIERQSAN